MVDILIVGGGSFATGLLSSLGRRGVPQGAVTALDFPDSLGPQECADALLAMLEGLGREILVLADFSDSGQDNDAFNALARLGKQGKLGDQDIEMLSGANTAMLYAAIQYRDQDMETVVAHALAAARLGVQKYNARTVIPNGSVPVTTRNVNYAHLSARQWLNVPYAQKSPTQKMDIYLPETGEGPFPLIVAIHGGGFIFGSKTDNQQVGPFEGLQRGFAVAAIDYRMLKEEIFPAAIYDVKEAIRFLRAHAGEYRLDPERFIAWGDSAGANLACLAAVTGDEALIAEDASGASAKLQAAIDWFGCINFLTMDDNVAESGFSRPSYSSPNSPESKYMGGPLMEVPERCAQSNPCTYLGPNTPPILIQHGRADQIVPFQQSREFYEAIVEACGADKVEYDLFEGVVHQDGKYETRENLDRVFAFIEKALNL